MGYADLEGGQVTGTRWVFNGGLANFYTVEGLREGRVTVERLMGHRSPELCGFMAEVGREFVARPFDGFPCPGTIGRLRSRYHDPDPPSPLERKMARRGAEVRGTIDYLHSDALVFSAGQPMPRMPSDRLDSPECLG